MKKTLFCDLDGTLIETKSGRTFPQDENDWILKDGITVAIDNYKPDYIHIISNQGGIDMGFVDEEKWNRKMLKVIETLSTTLNSTPEITYDYCTSNDNTFMFRKPNAGMIAAFQDTLKTKTTYLMIGDDSGKHHDFSDDDKKCAENAHVNYLDINDFIRKYNG